MALKDTWIDKVNGVDDILAEHINDIAQNVIEIQNELPIYEKTEDVNNKLSNYATIEHVEEYALAKNTTQTNVAQAYVKLAGGTQSLMNISDGVSHGNSIVKRFSNGGIWIVTPENPSQYYAVNVVYLKEYVDSAITIDETALDAMLEEVYA